MTDPASKQRSKKLVSTYLGMLKNKVTLWKTTSGTTPGLFWHQKVYMDDLTLQKALAAKNVPLRKVVTASMWGDIHVSCNCLHPDTKIPLLDGTIKTIKEIVDEKKEVWIYSTDEMGEFIPRKAIGFKSGEVDSLVEVCLDNGEKIQVTKDHRFRISDGSYREASKLSVGDSLLPLYRRFDCKGYEEIKSNQSDCWGSTHQLVAESSRKKEFTESQERSKEVTQCVHHMNYNKSDNRPDNLTWMGRVEHWKWHWGHIRHRYENDVQFRTKNKEGVRKHITNLNTNPTEALTRSRRENGRNRCQEWKERGLLSSWASKEMSKQWNHRVVSIREIQLDSKIDVYDLSVDRTQNFLLQAGIIVHNCPADLYWGFQYIRTRVDANYGPPELRKPRRNNVAQIGSICKHLENVLLVFPFWASEITKDLKNLFGAKTPEKEVKSNSKMGGEA